MIGVANALLFQKVTVTIDVQQVITWAIIGLIAGFMAGLLIRGRRYGLLSSIILGLVGALVGGFLFRILAAPTPEFLRGSVTISLIDIVVAFIGAIIVLVLLSLFYRSRPL